MTRLFHPTYAIISMGMLQVSSFSSGWSPQIRRVPLFPRGGCQLRDSLCRASMRSSEWDDYDWEDGKDNMDPTGPSARDEDKGDAEKSSLGSKNSSARDGNEWDDVQPGMGSMRSSARDGNEWEDNEWDVEKPDMGTGDQATDSRRDALERMWSTEARPEESNPFPASSERGGREAAACARNALLEGKRGLIIEVEVVQLDDRHKEFDLGILLSFVEEVARQLVVVGRVKVMYRTSDLESSARELAQAEIDADTARAESLESLRFCSFFEGAEGGVQRRIFDSDEEEIAMGEKVGRLMDEEDGLFLVVGPRSGPDIALLRKVMELAEGRPMIVLNPRMTLLPREMRGFETVYSLCQWRVVAVKPDSRASRPSPMGGSRGGKVITSSDGQPVPLVITTRKFPEKWKLFLDAEGRGFEELCSFDRKPPVSVICQRAQREITTIQREAARKLRVELQEKRERQRLERFNDDDEEEEEEDDNIEEQSDLRQRRDDDKDN
ncbi:unnamed protein product [Discosporangium mesarthrocarpum]